MRAASGTGERCSPRAWRNWWRCAARERAERKVAIVLFNFPPNAGTTGTAAYLSVFESLLNTLLAMKAAGYTVDLPDDASTRCASASSTATPQRFGTPPMWRRASPPTTMSARETLLAEIEAQWGPAPGRQQTDGASIFVLGERFGNVFVGVQPAFGYEGDPMRLLFERGFAPTHAFSAFYRWLREDFGAHAVLHFGTHGALEFMPGKQAGLSGACWPDRLIGDLPNFYLYASNNPSEGTLAKRRAGATLISYLTPPVAHAGLYRGLLDLKASLDRWRALSRTPSRRRARRARRADPGAGGGGRSRPGRAGLGRRAGGARSTELGAGDAGTRIHADPAWAACRRRAADARARRHAAAMAEAPMACRRAMPR